MNEERIEKIRRFLQKNWLPVLNKYNATKSKIRLSVRLQISLVYGIFMFFFGMLIFVPIGQVIYHSELCDSILKFHYGGQYWKIALTDVFRVAVLVYVSGMLLVLELATKNIRRIAEKLSDIMKQSNRITINNLEQERLQIDGIQSELQGVAVTINNMLDRLENAYENQKQFASDASHELRTPIAVVQGYVNMLDRWGAEDPEVLRESVDAIKNEAQSMRELVEKLLFLSRNDKKTLKLTKRKFNIGKMVEETVKEAEIIAKKRKVEALDIDPMIFYGDRQMMKEALRVLIENAIKYTSEGDTIYIGCEKAQNHCILTVADTGIGMDEKDMDHIFQRFYRSDHVRNSDISGHGLGLSIARLIVLKHVGTIEVKSQYTRGTSFRIILPLQKF